MSDEEIQEIKINRILADNCGYGNVKDWLLGLGLGQYYDVFIENGYDSFRICSEIQTIDIQTIGIYDDYHKRILIKGVARMNNPKAESVYHRLSVATPDDNEFKSLASELKIFPQPEYVHHLPNGHAAKLTEDLYKKKPTLAEKRAVRNMLVQLKIDLTDTVYEENSPELDTLSEQIAGQLEVEELSVYDVLCLLRGMAINNTSPKPTTHKLVYKVESSSIETPTTPESPEDVFSPTISETAQPKPTMRPKKPPRAFTNPEDKPLSAHLVNGSLTSPPTSITTSDTADWTKGNTCAYDILHSDSLEPQVMPNIKSPVKMIISTKPDDAPVPTLPDTPPNTCTEEELYIDLNGTVITENNIGATAKNKSISNNIFKRSKINSKKITEDSTQTAPKRPPNQPPPPPPISSVLAEAESSGKSKSDKSNKTNLTSGTENNESKKHSFFKRSVKPKTETKARNKKSKDESDLVPVIKELNESESRRPLAKVISKSTDNLNISAIREQCPSEELNNVGVKLCKQQGFSLLSQEANEELQRKKLLSTSDQPTNPNATDQEDSTIKFIPPNPVPRRRNSPEEPQILTNIPRSDKPVREEVSKYIHTLPRNPHPEGKGHPPPKKPIRNISEELIYNNIELPMPNPVPKARKLESPPLGLPQRSLTVTSRPQYKLSADTTQCPKDSSSNANQVRLKPEIPKGKKPVLKTKPALEGIHSIKEKSVSDLPVSNQPQVRTNQNRYEDKHPVLSVPPTVARTNSPLTAPPPPTTRRPGTPSNQAPEPPPIHSIPTMRPVAHVRPTKPPIITPPSAPSNVSEPRNADNWKKIEDKIYDILKEEDFICYLVTHYSRQNGESSITPGLVSRLADKTSLAIHHIAFALDNIRTQKLTELGKNSVPISMSEFDEMLIPTKIDSISSWLTEIGLPNYIDLFEENVHNIEDIKNLDADDLSELCINTKDRGYVLHSIEMIQ